MGTIIAGDGAGAGAGAGANGIAFGTLGTRTMGVRGGSRRLCLRLCVPGGMRVCTWEGVVQPPQTLPLPCLTGRPGCDANDDVMSIKGTLILVSL